jgi:hypothetical protein
MRHDVVVVHTPDLSTFYIVMPHGSGTETGECHVHNKIPWAISSCTLQGMSSMSAISTQHFLWISVKVL